MPANITVKDGTGNLQDLKTSLVDGAHVPHHRIEQIPDGANVALGARNSTESAAGDGDAIGLLKRLRSLSDAQLARLTEQVSRQDTLNSRLPVALEGGRLPVTLPGLATNSNILLLPMAARVGGPTTSPQIVNTANARGVQFVIRVSNLTPNGAALQPVIRGHDTANIFPYYLTLPHNITAVGNHIVELYPGLAPGVVNPNVLTNAADSVTRTSGLLPYIFDLLLNVSDGTTSYTYSVTYTLIN
ncbi:MAG: hypothetical protein MSG64_07575 [Pyrinomonadaceae bacterium MAG19_C2-C3]|nr:hypothetical protein [Pyrinomonadaceae bacterium MAG19_C2-C3]